MSCDCPSLIPVRLYLLLTHCECENQLLAGLGDWGVCVVVGGVGGGGAHTLWDTEKKWTCELWPSFLSASQFIPPACLL